MEGQNKDFLIYMQDHYGSDIQLQFVGIVNEKEVYQLIRTE